MQRSTKPEPELSPRIERLLEDIDTGKVKTTRYSMDEYKKHVKKLLKD